MRRFTGLMVLAILSLPSLIGCPGSDDDLIGKWVGGTAGVFESSYEFTRDGRVVNEVAVSGESETRDGTYSADNTADPHQLSIAYYDPDTGTTETVRMIYKVERDVLTLGYFLGGDFPESWDGVTGEQLDKL